MGKAKITISLVIIIIFTIYILEYYNSNRKNYYNYIVKSSCKIYTVSDKEDTVIQAFTNYGLYGINVKKQKYRIAIKYDTLILDRKLTDSEIQDLNYAIQVYYEFNNNKLEYSYSNIDSVFIVNDVDISVNSELKNRSPPSWDRYNIFMKYNNI